MRIKFKVLLVSVFCLSLFLVFDRVIFKNLLFILPNELEWDTSPWYNFLRKREDIRFSKNENGVLILGSSVALYSILPEKFSEKVNSKSEKGNWIRSEFYAHPSLTPSDFYHYKEDIVSKKPKSVIYVINPADLQLEYVKFENNELIYDEDGFFQDSVNTRHQNRLLYPDHFLSEHWKKILDLGKSKLEEFVSKTVSYGVRYRSFFYDPIQAWYMHRFRWGRSYHYYTGMIPEQGIYLRGWAKPKFEIDCEIETKVWKESIFIQKPETKLSIHRLGSKREPIFERTFPKKGWYYIQIPFSDPPSKLRLEFVSDKPVSSLEVDSRIFGTEEIYGIRLSQNFCRSTFREDHSYERISSLDDSRVESLSDQNYDIDYQRRIYRQNDEEDVLSRFKKIQVSKSDLSKSDRFIAWSQMEYLQQGILYLRSKGIRVFLVNSPENPKEKIYYGSSVWYSGYLSFLQNTMDDPNSFKDLSDFFPKKQSFLDPHHLTYSSSEVFTEKVSDLFLGFSKSGN
ncbi:hypothetical protein [Leptospira sarikeiensis]|uniref:Uncharacterized protein n=1 Tax=Leptospira sarikeiensis TaxID=2484943 RepID=A0A4R9K442_9LEPT|nr:hypothetical protein [Leptospira sarikeiensis]TGL59017.1 hypothetical protein EHQ64_16680 [Leptospira sarikeiensis]